VDLEACLSEGPSRLGHMFETEAPKAAVAAHAVRVPWPALVARPEGISVAAAAVDLAEAITRAAAGRAEHPDIGPGADVETDQGAEPDPDMASEAELVDALSCFERAKSTAEARQTRAMAALARRSVFAGCPQHGPDDPEHGIKVAASIVSAELRISPGHARTRVELACELVEALPATLEALSAGRIDGYRAKVLAEEIRPLAEIPDVRRMVERELLELAGRQTGPQLRAAARKAVLAAYPGAAQDRHDKARASRAISPPTPEPDGMACSLIRMAADDMAAFWAAVDAAARRARTDDPDDPRTLDQLRADTLAELCWSALQIGHLGCCNPGCAHVHQPLGTRHGRAAAVGVTVPISTLLGIDDQPGHLHGYGPITAEVARRIAADGTWRRLLTDPATGALLDYGTTRYAPPADLVDHVTARDRSCRFPTCTHPAESCDLDHTFPAADGGATTASNLGPLHRAHHIDKTHHGWQLDQPESGRYIWTFRTGHRYEVDPEIIGPLLQPPDPDTPSKSEPDEASPGRPPGSESDPDPPPF
jgi:Domain of unknown function (DUF222)